MEIDHTGLFVTDLEATRTFYETYFNGRASSLYHNARTGLRAYFLKFVGGARLEILARPEDADRAPASWCGWNHIAFRVGSRQVVDSLTDQLRTDGYTVINGPRISGAGHYVSVVLDPEGNQIELLA